ncbi:SDR family NAD(P)-dependent oxidoreductase [Streptomyces cinnabarinus]|uniref:SDR family NAD(P)-dependent oxidoreductase n=1 Tax=Streptomyces cinnabarinus TaxID=67287 RepID=A0ABY7K664_9ACTN|nr:SDR family NAD(P)-dependent oxidoreductase [Streptomyces cinnabarinus]WAZ19993.1 SDR family NAD(P)-dependent oxidoreductase [Streptomyces cinnabarinus]
MLELAGRTAFITGGAQGIGLGLARAFAKEGMRLAVADIDAEALAEAGAELAAMTQVATFTLDVTDRDAYARVADEAEQRLGPVSLLCNNAGVGGSYPVSAMSYALWDLILGVNIGGVVNGLQTFLPRMIARGEPSHIVNTASTAGLAPQGGQGGYMYEGTKAGVIGLSEGLARQLGHEGHPIGVTVLCPGLVATNLVASNRAARGRITGDLGLTAEQEEDREKLLTEQDFYLRQLGLSPDAVGEMLVEGVRSGKPYVITDRGVAEPLAARSKALFMALPPETEHDRRIARHVAAQMREAARSGGRTH